MRGAKIGGAWLAENGVKWFGLKGKQISEVFVTEKVLISQAGRAARVEGMAGPPD